MIFLIKRFNGIYEMLEINNYIKHFDSNFLLDHFLRLCKHQKKCYGALPWGLSS